MRRPRAAAALALLAVAAALVVAGAAVPAVGSAQSADGGENGTDLPDHVEQRTAMIDGELLVAPCAAAPPEHDGPPAVLRNGTADGAGDGTNGTEDGANGTEDGANGTEDGANDTTAASGGVLAGEGAGAGVVGQVDGIWYDQPLGIDESGALTRAELDALVARTAARVEAMRCLDYERRPEVEVVTRRTMENRQEHELNARSDASQRFDDARLEATLLVGSAVDPTAVRARTRGAAVRALYDPARESVTLLGGPTPGGVVNASGVDEATLAHELVHALQDQTYDLSRFDAETTDAAMAEAALIEGDAVLLERWYADRCAPDGWNGSCLSASPPPTDAEPDVGLNLLLFQPRNDGPALVEDWFRAEGWMAVDARYEDPPGSTYEVLYPWEPAAGERSFVPIRTPVAPGWQRIRPPDGPSNDVVGPGAIAAALMTPTFESGSDAIYPAEALQRTGSATGRDRHRRYDYRVGMLRAWRADRLIAYESDGGEVASVWRSEWATEEDAAEFRARYGDLLDVRGASPDRRLDGVYHFSDRGAWRGTVYVQTEGRHVTVVHGPDLPALRTLHPDVPRASPGGARSDGPPAGPMEREDLSRAGAVAALLAVLAFVVTMLRRGEV